MTTVQNPVLAMTKHLMWTRSGVVWATWRLQGMPYGFAADATKQLARLQHQALFQALRGEALLLGLCASLDPVQVAERMLSGLRVDEHPEWAREVSLTLDSLADVPVGERAFWLAVPLAGTNARHRLRSAAHAVEAELRDVLALPRRVPSPAEVDEALRIAGRVEEAIPGAFGAVPATPAELVWMAQHAQLRGLDLDAEAPVPGTDGTSSLVGDEGDRIVAAAELAEPVLDEGGQSDLAPRSTERLAPFRRRFLKVSSPFSEQPSYQVLLALTGAPKGGWVVPGVEWLARVDDFAFPVDWAVRLQIASGQAVKRRNKSAENTLRDQITQQHVDGETSIVDNGGHLGDVAEALQSYADALGRSDKEVEVQATTILAIGAPTADEARVLATHVRQTYQLAEFVLDAPLGGQEPLWWAMQPGAPTERLVRELTQITTGREFASAVPLVSTELGDRAGLHLADNITAGRRTPVFLDLEGTIRADRSASVGLVAELGAGKSYTMKKIAGDLIDRGGRVFIIDRTEAREYAKFAGSLLPGQTALVDLMRPACSLDPLRMFGVREGARHVQSLFSAMLGVRPRDELGVELARLLSPEHVGSVGVTSLGALRAHLADAPAGSQRARLHGLMSMVAEKDLGRVLFDDSLPPLDLGARAIIPLTAGLPLPSEHELGSRHLFDELPLEKIFGRAMYAFLTGLARQICFSSGEFTMFCADECHHITTSPEGQAHVLDFLRDGRKHNAVAVLASHDPHDFGDVRARGLIPIRIVMRHSDPELAERALEWLDRGIAGDARILTELTERVSPAGPDGRVAPDRRGEALFRDARQRIGKVRIVAPERAERREMISTTPVAAGGEPTA